MTYPIRWSRGSGCTSPHGSMLLANYIPIHLSGTCGGAAARSARAATQTSFKRWTGASRSSPPRKDTRTTSASSTSGSLTYSFPTNARLRFSSHAQRGHARPPARPHVRADRASCSVISLGRDTRTRVWRRRGLPTSPSADRYRRLPHRLFHVHAAQRHRSAPRLVLDLLGCVFRGAPSARAVLLCAQVRCHSRRPRRMGTQGARRAGGRVWFDANGPRSAWQEA